MTKRVSSGGPISLDMSVTFELTPLDALPPPVYPQEEYVVDSLATGFFCRKPGCGVWNGDAKEFRRTCRSCGADRPRRDHVVRGTRGK